MPNFAHGLFLVFILAWIGFVSVGVTLGGLVHVMPLIALLILVNRIRHTSRAPTVSAPVEKTAQPTETEVAAP
jgi:hypothetical protein